MRSGHRPRGRKFYGAVFRDGNIWRDKLVVLRAAPNDRPDSLFGFVVGKRVGKAVVRNKVRRRLREGVKTLPIQPGWDVVLSARPESAQADYWRMRESVRRLLSKANLLNHGADS